MKVTLLMFVLWCLFAIYVITHKPVRVYEGIIKCNTSAFQEGDLLIIDENGIRKAMPWDTIATRVGIVTCVGDTGEILIKYAK